MPLKDKIEYRQYMKDYMIRQRNRQGNTQKITQPKTQPQRQPQTQTRTQPQTQTQTQPQTQTEGYIYCASNISFDGIYKIGFTMETPNIRAKSLYNTSVPFPFKIEFAKIVLFPRDKELNIHNILNKYRLTHNREFFKCNKDVIYNVFDLIEGEWHNEDGTEISINTQTN